MVRNDHIWRDGVIGNTKDFDSFIVGSNPARAAILTSNTYIARGRPRRPGVRPCLGGTVRADDNYERNVRNERNMD